MGVMLATAALLGQVYDPPCDPGIACEGLSDDALTAGIILWGLFFAGLVLLLIGAIFRDFVKGLYWRYKYGSADGIGSERESLQRRGYERFTVQRVKGKVVVTWSCSNCFAYNMDVPYLQIVGKSQLDACKKSGEHR